MGESSFASTSTSTSENQHEQSQIGTASGHPLGAVRVETEIASEVEVIGGGGGGGLEDDDDYEEDSSDGDDYDYHRAMKGTRG